MGVFLNNKIFNYLKDNNLKVGDHLWPLRVALTGEKASPGPFEIAEVYGKKKTISLVNEALKKI